MKKLNIFFIFFYCVLITNVAFAQIDRYFEEVFEAELTHSDVIYGANATVLQFPILGTMVPEDLLMDVYEPIGDVEEERPVVLVFHDGSFLPPGLNGQIAGTKTDSSSVEICKQLARRGFTAVSLTYRLGWNPFAPSSVEMATLFFQAIYRGIQDGRTAVRFLRKTYAEDNNPYHINPDQITVWGNGSAGLISLGMVGLSDYNEILSTSYPVGKFLLDLDGDGVSETPMVIEEVHGDIEGKVTTIVPPNPFGLLEGDTSNYANHPAYSSDVHLSVNIGGAIEDLSWLDDNTTPIISIQHPFDPDFPYGNKVFIGCNNPAPIFNLQGGKLIGEWLEISGINQMWKDLNFEDEITTEAMEAASVHGNHPYYEGVYPFFTPENSGGYTEGIVINWWNPTDSSSTMYGPCAGVPWNECVSPFGGLTFHEHGLLLNEGMSAEKAKANIAKVMGYFIPRACLALGLECAIEVSTEEFSSEIANVKLIPNPAKNKVTVVSSATIVEKVEIYTVNGRQVKILNGGGDLEVVIDLAGQAPGMYVLKIYMDEGLIVEKLVVE